LAEEPYQVVVDACCVKTSKVQKGGLESYEKAKNDIKDWMSKDKSSQCRFTTMFDLYALPKDFPGWELAEKKKKNDPYGCVKHLECELAKDIGSPRFIPYIQLHEFEALLLADPRKLEEVYDLRKKEIEHLSNMVKGQNPELIDGGRETAPSKRILKEIPGYRKKTAGIFVVEKIGLPTLRQKCHHFDEWVRKLEELR
jgi:hypothetical protein